MIKEFCFPNHLFFRLTGFFTTQLLVITILVSIPYQAIAGVWTNEDANTITINSANYNAYCDKKTGLCDFYSKSGEILFENAGDIYIGEWEQKKEFGDKREKFDENCIKKRDYEVSFSNFLEDGNTATAIFTQTKPGEVQFDTTYTFGQNDSKVLVNGRITYLVEKDITNEVIKTGVPGAFSVYTLDPFDKANLVNDVQIDNMDDIGSWVSYGNGQATLEKNVDPNYIKEGNGSIKVVLKDDGDPSDERTGISKLFSSTDYPNKKCLSFWIYPQEELWFYVKIYSTLGSPETRTIKFPANTWSLFQWNFERSYGLNRLSGFYKIQISALENYLGVGELPLYIDDIRFSDDIENGLMSSIGQGGGYDNWYGDGIYTIDESFCNSGNGSLRWSGLDLSDITSEFRVYQYTTEKSSKANLAMPTNIVDYDYIVFDSYATCDLRIGGSLHDINGNNYRTVYTNPNTWQTIMWDFKNDYCCYDAIDYNHVLYYALSLRGDTGTSDSLIWVDNLRLVKLEDGYSIFDGYSFKYDEAGKGVKYSSRTFKTNNQTYIYGDNFGASNIEYMDKNPGDETVDCYIYKIDMHTFDSSVGRDGNEEGDLCFYKEITRKPTDVSEGTIVYDINTPNTTEVIKSRWPRNFDAAYSISEDDFWFKSQKAFYCGTSDTSSPDYSKKGIVGHNLRVTNNLWYYMMDADGGGTYEDYNDTKEFFDLIYDSGIEMAIHSPGIVNDIRSEAIEALDNLVANYGTRQWVDHWSSGNPEDFVRRGAFTTVNGNSNDSNDGYYMLDLLKDRDFKYIWAMPLVMSSSNATPNLFYDGYRVSWPLPQRNQVIDSSGGTGVVYLYGRGAGNGYDDFLQSFGGGNIAELEKVIEDNGLVLVYTHAHVDYYDEIGDIYVLKSGAEDVFAWLETKQDDGSLWIDTVSNILDWMIDLENVIITNQQANTVTVLNENNKPLSGISLKVLDDTVRYAKINNLYQIYVDGNSVALPKFSADESKTIEIGTGIYDNNLPKLTSLPAHVNVDAATYDANTEIVTLTFDYLETPGISSKPINAVINNLISPFLNVTNTITAEGNTILSTILPASPVTFETVNMEIAPSSNSVDITLYDWDTSVNYIERWSETVDGPMSVDHTVENLAANTFYKVRIDEAEYEMYLSNGSGQMTFITSYNAPGTHTLVIELCLSPDIDSSGFVNFTDYAKLNMNWLNEGDELSGDLSCDGVVDFNDIDILANYWLTDIPVP